MILLPADIVQLLVADVQDQATLRSCALVSRTFLYFSQQRIFKQVFIDTRSPLEEAKWIKLYHILSYNPQLCLFVKELVIDGYSKWFQHSSSITGQLDLEWTLKNKDVMMSQLLSMLPALQHLEIEGMGDVSRCIGPLAEAALARLLVSPTLVSLAFDSVGQLPLWLLTSSPQLKYLSIGHINTIRLVQGELKGELLDGTGPTSLLCSLDIVLLGEKVMEYLNSQQFLLNCSRLEQLFLDCYGEEGTVALLWAFTRSVAHSLQRMCVAGAHAFLATFHIDDFPLVQDWELVTPFYTTVDGTLPSLISFFSGTSTIQSVSTIDLRFNPGWKTLPTFDDTVLDLWSTLDEMLDGPHYSRMKSFSISSVPDIPSLSRDFHSYFPRLVARGIFNLTR